MLILNYGIILEYDVMLIFFSVLNNDRIDLSMIFFFLLFVLF